MPALTSCEYIPALDGFRAASITLVLLAHFGLGDLVPGIFGVTIFFFISGFLITRQLLTEMRDLGELSLRRFYIRRGLRLYPALLVMVVVGGAAFAAAGGEISYKDFFWAIFYGANYHSMAGGNTSGIPNVGHPFSILWSLAVEEHYYLIFPCLVLLLGRSPRRLLISIICLIFLVTVWRFGISLDCATNPPVGLCADPLRIEHGTDTRADSILYGALLAVMLCADTAPYILRVLKNRFAFALCLAVLLATFIIRDAWFRETIRFSLQGIGLTVCVGGVLFSPSLAFLNKFLSRGAFVIIGRWSYSLYLWHWLVYVFGGLWLPSTLWRPIVVQAMPKPMWLLILLPFMIGASFVLAMASYYGVEQPTMKLRRAFGSRATRFVVTKESGY